MSSKSEKQDFMAFIDTSGPKKQVSGRSQSEIQVGLNLYPMI